MVIAIYNISDCSGTNYDKGYYGVMDQSINDSDDAWWYCWWRWWCSIKTWWWRRWGPWWSCCWPTWWWPAPEEIRTSLYSGSGCWYASLLSWNKMPRWKAAMDNCKILQRRKYMTWGFCATNAYDKENILPNTCSSTKEFLQDLSSITELLLDCSWWPATWSKWSSKRSSNVVTWAMSFISFYPNPSPIIGYSCHSLNPLLRAV